MGGEVGLGWDGSERGWVELTGNDGNKGSE